MQRRGCVSTFSPAVIEGHRSSLVSVTILSRLNRVRTIACDQCQVADRVPTFMLSMFSFMYYHLQPKMTIKLLVVSSLSPNPSH